MRSSARTSALSRTRRAAAPRAGGSTAASLSRPGCCRRRARPYLPHTSPISPLHLPYNSPVPPLYLLYISPAVAGGAGRRLPGHGAPSAPLPAGLGRGRRVRARLAAAARAARRRRRRGRRARGERARAGRALCARGGPAPRALPDHAGRRGNPHPNPNPSPSRNPNPNPDPDPSPDPAQVWRGETAGELPTARREAASAVRDTLEIFQWHGEEVRAHGTHGHLHGHVRQRRGVCARAPLRRVRTPCSIHA